MKIKLEKIYFIISFFISIAIAMQLEYVFFGIANLLPLILIGLSFFIIIMFSLYDFDYIGKKEFYFLYFFFFLVFVFFLMWSNYINVNFVTRTIAFLVYIGLSYFVVNHLLYRIKYEYIYKSFLMGILSSTTVLIIECLFRILNPTMAIKGDWYTGVNEPTPVGLDIGWDFLESKAYYAYKYSSIMFYDSNYVGLFSLCILICTFSLAFKYKFNFLFSFLIFTNSLLIILSFSRSAIFAMILVLFFYFLLYLYKKKKIILFFSFLILLVSIFIISVFNVLSFISTDESFITKVSIFLSIEKFFNFPIFDILFGYGLLNGGFVISYQEGKYAHALFPVLLGQIGLIGTFIYISLFIIMCVRSGIHGIVLLFTFFLTGISLVDPWQIIYFWSALYMLYLKRKSPHHILVIKD